jgi:hypothetical protein
MIQMKKLRLAGILAALAIMAAGSASAAPISFSFWNDGYIADVDGCLGGGACLRVTTGGDVTETSGLPGVNEWTFTGVMEYTLGWPLVGNGTDIGWSFLDVGGVNNLYGTFTSISFDLMTYFVSYVITDGTGMFANAKGAGSSTLKLSWNGSFNEFGRMWAEVPEPGTTALFAAGLMLIGFMAWRRRRELPQK